MKRLVLAGIAALALVAVAPAASEAQVRVSVNLGPRYGYRHGYVERVYRYTPRTYYGGYHYTYRNSYRGYQYSRPRVAVVRVYRPAPVVIIHRNQHRAYRGRGYRY